MPLGCYAPARDRTIFSRSLVPLRVNPCKSEQIEGSLWSHRNYIRFPLGPRIPRPPPESQNLPFAEIMDWLWVSLSQDLFWKTGNQFLALAERPTWLLSNSKSSPRNIFLANLLKKPGVFCIFSVFRASVCNQLPDPLIFIRLRIPSHCLFKTSMSYLVVSMSSELI